MTATLAPDKPHATNLKEEFLRLHKAFFDSFAEMRESQLRSIALLTEIPTSKTSYEFIKNRPTPTKALQHELRIVIAMRSELFQGMRQPEFIQDGLEQILDIMQAVVNSDSSP